MKSGCIEEQRGFHKHHKQSGKSAFKHEKIPQQEWECKPSKVPDPHVEVIFKDNRWGQFEYLPLGLEWLVLTWPEETECEECIDIFGK